MNQFVDFCKEGCAYIKESDVEDYISRACDNGFGKYRYCLHNKPEDSLHEMIIVTSKDDIKYPDKHLYTTESNIIIRGKLLVVLFSDEGEIEKAFILSPDELFYYRCQKNKYHLTLPLTETAVYIEIKEGPFEEKSNIYPDWAPNRNNAESIRDYNKDIYNRAMQMIAF